MLFSEPVASFITLLERV